MLFLLTLFSLSVISYAQTFAYTLPPDVRFVNQEDIGNVGLSGVVSFPSQKLTCEYVGYYNYLFVPPNHLTQFYWETPCEFGTGAPTKQSVWLIFNQTGYLSYAIDAATPDDCSSSSGPFEACVAEWNTGSKQGLWTSECSTGSSTSTWNAMVTQSGQLTSLSWNITGADGDVLQTTSFRLKTQAESAPDAASFDVPEPCTE